MTNKKIHTQQVKIHNDWLPKKSAGMQSKKIQLMMRKKKSIKRSRNRIRELTDKYIKTVLTTAFSTFQKIT